MLHITGWQMHYTYDIHTSQSRCEEPKKKTIRCYPYTFFLFWILRRMVKNIAEAPTLPRIRCTSCANLTRRSRCDKRSRSKATGRVITSDKAVLVLAANMLTRKILRSPRSLTATPTITTTTTTTTNYHHLPPGHERRCLYSRQTP